MLKIILMLNHYCIHTVLSNSGKTEDGDHSQPAEGSDAKTTLCTLSAQRRGSGKGKTIAAGTAIGDHSVNLMLKNMQRSDLATTITFTGCFS